MPFVSLFTKKKLGKEKTDLKAGVCAEGRAIHQAEGERKAREDQATEPRIHLRGIADSIVS